MPKLSVWDTDKERHVEFWCPGCGHSHVIPTLGPKGWQWNEDADRPTMSPSILVMPSKVQRRCHSFIRDGRIEYCSDSDHPLSGQTVDLPDLADWPDGSYIEASKSRE